MRRKWRKIFGEGKYFLRRRRRTEKEKEGKYHGGGKIYAGTKGYTIGPRRSKKKTEINSSYERRDIEKQMFIANICQTKICSMSNQNSFFSSSEFYVIKIYIPFID